MRQDGRRRSAAVPVGLAALALSGLLAAHAGLGDWNPRYCPVPAPIPPAAEPPGGGLDGFDSPYLGHTGSWDGKGGALGGGSKGPDMDIEVRMGLRWTFVPAYWRALEPDGPVDLAVEVPPAWRSLDSHVIGAHDRGLNVFMQAPVMGGNAGGPPAWAGRRDPGRSAPLEMDAAAAFAGKLAERYRPGGTLAMEMGWSDGYGVRVWELDNEPDSYLTNWKGQAGDYAEFVTRCAGRIREADPGAVIVTPSWTGGSDAMVWAERTLDASAMEGSDVYRNNGMPHSIGPDTDVVSFHNYEGLASIVGGNDATVTCNFNQIRQIFEAAEGEPGFDYPRKEAYWHTEGNFDFFGVMSPARRANWRGQFFARAFAAGIRKITVMDASPPEREAVRRFIRLLPDPFPMLEAREDLIVERGVVWAFRRPGGEAPEDGQVWVMWARNGSSGAVAWLPVQAGRVLLVPPAGPVREVRALRGWARVVLPGDAKISPTILVVDRS